MSPAERGPGVGAGSFTPSDVRAQHRTEPAKEIPSATVARLPGYLRALTSFSERGIRTVSSGELADATGVNPAQLRKDLSHLGSYGTRGVGYDVEFLRFQIGQQVGTATDWPVVIVGVGNLGTALAKNADFGSRGGFRVVALVDTNPALIGRELDGLTITGQDRLADCVRATGAVIAVIATPAEAAQPICDELVSVGITSILNFTATVLAVPDSVTVRKVDLGQELQILAYHEQQKLEASRRLRRRAGAGAPGQASARSVGSSAAGRAPAPTPHGGSSITKEGAGR